MAPTKEELIIAAGQFLGAFRLAISNIQLYPVGSKAVQDSLDSAAKILETITGQFEILAFSVVDNQLLVNGHHLDSKSETLSAAQAMIKLAESRKLRGVIFEKGVARQELSSFLEIMSRKPRKEDASENLEESMKKAGIDKIRINKMVYVAVNNEGERIEAKEEPLDIEKIKKLSREELNKQIDGERGKYSQLEKEVKEGKRSDSDLAILKGRLQQLLALSQEKFAALGAGAGPEEEIGPSALSHEQKLVQNAENLFSQEADRLLLPENRQQLAQLIKDLDDINKMPLATKIVDKVAANLESSLVTNRLEAVRSFKELESTVDTLSDKAVQQNLDEKFLVTEDKEVEEQVYVELAELLESGAKRLFREGDYDRGEQIIGMFKRHTVEPNKDFSRRLDCANEILKRLAGSEILQILISDLRSDDKKTQSQAYGVVMKFETASIRPLIDAIKETEDYHLRKVVAFVLKKIGEGAVWELVKEITPQVSLESAKRVIEVLDGLGYQDTMINQLQTAFYHHNPAVRQAILRCISRIGSLKANQFVCSAVSDEDPSIRLEAVRQLSKLRFKEAVETLVELIKINGLFGNEPEDLLQAEACVSLSQLRDPEAISSLMGAAGNQSMFQKKKSIKVRVAALHALAAFDRQDVTVFLEKQAKSKNAMISKVAQDALAAQQEYAKKRASQVV